MPGEGAMSGRIEIEKAGPVGILRFANDDRGLMDAGTEKALAPALDVVEQDDDIRVVILTGGEPGVFIRHFDLAHLKQRGEDLARRGKTFSLDRMVPETPVHRAFRRIETSRKPYVAAINGFAMGGGFEIALCCDIRIAEDGDYSIGLPEINAGLLPGAGGTQRLPRLIGQARALEFILLGRTVDPRTAAAIGLVSACVAGPVLPHAMDIAARLASRSPLALAHVKYLVREASLNPLEAGLAPERTLFCDLLRSPEALAAMDRIETTHRDIRREPESRR
jgi:enoyl-CoA hydratase